MRCPIVAMPTSLHASARPCPLAPARLPPQRLDGAVMVLDAVLMALVCCECGLVGCGHGSARPHSACPARRSSRSPFLPSICYCCCASSHVGPACSFWRAEGVPHQLQEPRGVVQRQGRHYPHANREGRRAPRPAARLRLRERGPACFSACMPLPSASPACLPPASRCCAAMAPCRCRTGSTARTTSGQTRCALPLFCTTCAQPAVQHSRGCTTARCTLCGSVGLDGRMHARMHARTGPELPLQRAPHARMRSARPHARPRPDSQLPQEVEHRHACCLHRGLWHPRLCRVVSCAAPPRMHDRAPALALQRQRHSCSRAGAHVLLDSVSHRLQTPSPCAGGSSPSSRPEQQLYV